jgi:acetyl-CoA acetyltransferase
MTSSYRDRIAITGIGASEFTNHPSDEVNHLDALLREACDDAITDAGLTTADVDGVVTDSDLMAKAFPPPELAELVGINLAYSATSLGYAAGLVASPLEAAMAIEDGLAEHVLCYFGATWATDMARSSRDDAGPYSYHTTDPYKANLEVPFAWVPQPVYLAAWAHRHFHEYGTTKEQLGAVAVQTRDNAVENDDVESAAPADLDEYLAASPIVEPFNRHDCCHISDGAGAFVMSAADAAEELPHDPVYVKGVGTGFEPYSESSYLTQNADITTLPSRLSGPKAFEAAGLSPEAMDFAQLYDCFTHVNIIQLEDLGFCEKGEGGRFVQEMETGPNGDLPVNTHGGLLSQTYWIGMNHIIEAVEQLRGTADNQVRSADAGVVTGWGASQHATLILGGDRS